LIKLLLCSILIPLLLLGITLLIMFLVPTFGLLLGIVLSSVVLILIIGYGYPVWFKDYMEKKG